MTQASTNLWHGISLLPTCKSRKTPTQKKKNNIFKMKLEHLSIYGTFVCMPMRKKWDNVFLKKKKKSLHTTLQDGLTHLQRDVAQLSHLIEVSEGVMEFFPGLVSLKHKGAVGLTLGLQRPVSRSLLLGLQRLGMVWHHVPWCHSELQQTTPAREMARG